MIVLLLVVGATWSLTRLIVTDNITERPRRFIIRRTARKHPKIGQLLGCPWCVATWAAAAVVAATDHYTSVPLPLATVAAARVAAGWLAAATS